MSPTNCLEKIARDYFQSVPIQIIVGVISILTIFTYILSTYLSSSEFHKYYLLQCCIIIESLSFLADTFFSTLLAFSPIEYLFSFTGISDIISLFFSISLFFLPYHFFVNLGFFRCLRMLNIIRIVRMHRDSFPSFQDPIIFETFRLIVKIIVLLLVFTGIIHSLSQLGPEMFHDETNGNGGLTWHRSLYFVIVTMTTVGYGDIYPVTYVSQTMIVMIILVSFVTLPVLASSFVESLYARPEYGGKLSLPTGCAHVCIMGIVSPAMLNQLLAEFSLASIEGEDGRANYISSSDQISQYMMNSVNILRTSHPVFNTMIVFLSPGSPNPDLKKILFSSEAHTRRAVYFSGSCRVSSDLERVQAHKALAIIILSDNITNSLRDEEDSFFLSTISLNMFLQRNLFRQKANHEGIEGNKACDGDEDTKTKTKTRYVQTPRLITMLTHTAKPQVVLTTGGVDVVFPLQEFTHRLFGIGSALPGFLAVFTKLTQQTHSTSPTKSQSVSIHQINVSLKPLRGTQEMTSSENHFLQLVFKCSSILFSQLAARLIQESRGRVILIGVKLVKLENKSPTVKDKLVFINPSYSSSSSSLVSLSSCQSLFVMATTKIFAKHALYSVLKKYSSSHNPRESSLLIHSSPPHEKRSSRLVSLETSQPQLLSDDLSAIEPNSTTSNAQSGGELLETPHELFRLCPFIRLETDATLAKAQSSEYFGHLVLIFSSSGSKDLVPSTALLRQVMNFLESYRYYSQFTATNASLSPYPPSSKVIILSDRADELAELTEKIGFSQPSLLIGVSFYHGSPKNIDHLRLCCVVTARSVILLRSPVTYHNWVSSSSSLSPNSIPTMNQDKDSIIVSLTIHHLIHIALNKKNHQEKKAKFELKRLPLTRNEIPYSNEIGSKTEEGQGQDHHQHQHHQYHQHQHASLRHIPFFAAHLNDFTNVSYLLPLEQLSKFDSSAHKDQSNFPPWNDWNLISSGSILSQHLFYLLLLHSFLIPDLIALWEDILQFPLQSLSYSATSSPLSHQSLPKIQRISCPSDMIGLKYSQFIESLITADEEIIHIPIAIYRERVVLQETRNGALNRGEGDGNGNGDCDGNGRDESGLLTTNFLCNHLPYLFLAPSFDFILSEDDWIFLLSSSQGGRALEREVGE